VWNAELTADGTTQDLHSGMEPSSHSPSGAPDASGVVSHDQEIYLYATHATLTIPSLTAKQYTLYTGAGTLLSASSLSLQGATGRLSAQATSVDLAGSALKMSGQAEAILAGTGANSPFTVQLGGKADSLVVDGRPVPLSTVPVSPTRSGLTVFLWGLGMVALAAVSWLPVRRQAANYHLEKARALQAPGQAMALVKHCSRALKWNPRLGRAYLLRAYAWTQLRQYAHALDDHHLANRHLPRKETDLLARNAKEAARTCAVLRQGDQALVWLRVAMTHDPRLRAHAEAHPAKANPAPEEPPGYG
jgi:tetratricopeptide (TPR) repeat protein